MTWKLPAEGFGHAFAWKQALVDNGWIHDNSTASHIESDTMKKELLLKIWKEEDIADHTFLDKMMWHQPSWRNYSIWVCMQCCNNLLVKIINGTVVAVLGKVTRITYISFAKINVSGNTIGHCISLSFMCQMCLCTCQDSQRAGSFFHDDCIILNSFNRRKRIMVGYRQATSYLLEEMNPIICSSLSNLLLFL